MLTSTQKDDLPRLRAGEFRKTYRAITEPVAVLRYGRVIGYWWPKHPKTAESGS